MSDRTVSQAAQELERVDNPFRVGQSGGTTVTGEVAVQRELAEVQAAIVMARRFPRDPGAAFDAIQRSCTRKGLAEASLYSYSRGGTEITGPSIRLAEALAQAWTNLAFGIRELEQRNGESTVEAYCWDLESNIRQSRIFQVPHERHSRAGTTKLTDPRDVYELVANSAARRLRACILSTIPGDVIEAAVEQCELTMKVSADTSPEALRKVADAFKTAFGVTQEQIEKRCQCRLEAIRAAQVVQLRKIYASLKDGMSAPADWFEGAASSAAAVVAAADAKAKPAADKPATKEKPIAGDPPAQAATGDRRDARSDVKDAGISPGKDQPTPAATQPDRPKDQPIAQQVQPQPEPTADGAFFLSDDIGEPVEAPDGWEAFSAADAFADRFMSLMETTANPDALWENNRDAIDEIADKLPGLHVEMKDSYAAADQRVTKAEAAALAAQQRAQEQPPASEPEADAGGDGPGDGIPPLKVPLTAAGKVSWPQYATTARKELDALSTQADVSAWVNRNFPTYHGKAIEAAIDKHVRETRARIDADKRVVQQTVDAPATEQSQPQQATDRDAATAGDWLKEIAALPSLSAHMEFVAGGAYKAKMSRWDRERRDLHDAISDAVAAKHVALRGGVS